MLQEIFVKFYRQQVYCNWSTRHTQKKKKISMRSEYDMKHDLYDNKNKQISNSRLEINVKTLCKWFAGMVLEIYAEMKIMWQELYIQLCQFYHI